MSYIPHDQNHSKDFFRFNVVLLLFIAILFIDCRQHKSNQEEIEEPFIEMPEAFVGEEYSFAIEVEGLEPPLVWYVDEPSSFPEGLVFDTISGVVKGVPLRGGNYKFKLYLANVAGESEFYEVVSFLTITDELEEKNFSDLQIVTKSPLPYATVGQSYNLQLMARGTNKPLAWRADMLPASLRLDSVTGIIEGIPRDRGRYCVNIYVHEKGNESLIEHKLFGLVIGDKLTNVDNDINRLSPRIKEEALAKLECGSIVFNPPQKMVVGKRREVALYLSLDLSDKEIKEEILKRTNIKQALDEVKQKGVDVSKVEKSIDDLETKITESEKREIEVREEEFEIIEKELKEVEKQGATKEEIDRAVQDLQEAVDEVRNIVVVGRLLSANVRLTNQMKANLYGTSFEIAPLSSEVQTVNNYGITEWKWDIKALKPNVQRLRLELSAMVNQDGASAPMTIQIFEKNIDVEITPMIKIKEFHNANWQWIWGTLFIPILIWLGRLIYKRVSAREKLE